MMWSRFMKLSAIPWVMLVRWFGILTASSKAVPTRAVTVP
jgi:hypothetical protein